MLKALLQLLVIFLVKETLSIECSGEFPVRIGGSDGETLFKCLQVDNSGNWLVGGSTESLLLSGSATKKAFLTRFDPSFIELDSTTFEAPSYSFDSVFTC